MQKHKPYVTLRPKGNLVYHTYSLQMNHQLLPFVFFPTTAAALNVSRFRVVLGAGFPPLYHSPVAEASNATASSIAPPPQPQPSLLLLLMLLLESPT